MALDAVNHRQRCLQTPLKELVNLQGTVIARTAINCCELFGASNTNPQRSEGVEEIGDERAHSHMRRFRPQPRSPWTRGHSVRSSHKHAHVVHLPVKDEAWVVAVDLHGRKIRVELQRHNPPQIRSGRSCKSSLVIARMKLLTTGIAARRRRRRVDSDLTLMRWTTSFFFHFVLYLCDPGPSK